MSQHQAMLRPQAGRPEWLAAISIALVTVLLLLFPYWLGHTTAAPDTIFTGILMNPEDSQTYFAKMQLGREGAWLYTDRFTPEPHAPFFVGAFYIALGHLARWLGLTLIQVWHLARVVTGFIMIVTTFAFAGVFFENRRGRWTAFLLAVFGSGLGWLPFLLGQPYWLGYFPVDFKMPEAHLFFTALTFPHIALSTALLLLSFWLTLLALQHKGRQWLFALAAGLANLLLGIIHPLLLYVVVLAGSLYWFYLALSARRILWREGFVFAIAFLVPAPLVLYYALSLTTNPVFQGWDAQREGTISPPWLHYLLAYGPMLFLALLLWFKERRVKVLLPPWAFLWTWVLAVALLLYAPLNSQRRFVQAVHVPLSILATAGLLAVVLPRLVRTAPFRRLTAHPRYSRQGMIRLLLVLFLGFMSLSNLYVYASVSVSAVVQQPYPLFRPVAEARAVDWLRAHTSSTAVVLGAYQSGNYIAAHAGNRVVSGHWAETVAFEEKQAAIARFFDAETSTTWRLALLTEYGVDYVWYGPQEQALGAFDPGSAPYLEPVYGGEEITIFAVAPLPD